MHGVGSWEKADMPSPENVGLHRLSENAVLMSDTCNAARATKRLVAEMAEAAGRAKIGDAAWEKMSEEEQQQKVKVHLGDATATFATSSSRPWPAVPLSSSRTSSRTACPSSPCLIG